MNTDNLQQLVTTALDDLKATDISVLNVSKLTAMMDVMVICCGRSPRHVKSLADNVVKQAKQNGVQPLSVEGQQVGEWVLIDLADVVVHIMLREVRDFYQLEQLWETEENQQIKA